MQTIRETQASLLKNKHLAQIALTRQTHQRVGNQTNIIDNAVETYTTDNQITTCPDPTGVGGNLRRPLLREDHTFNVRDNNHSAQKFEPAT